MRWILFSIIGVIALATLIIIINVLIRESRYNRPTHFSYKEPYTEDAQERAGELGEKVTFTFLRSLLRDDEYLFTNILLPTRNNKTTEIDSVLVSRKGVFCIEIKRWSGHISGTDEDEYWYQRYDDGRKSKSLRNPVKQNDNHCDVLEKLFSDKYLVDNIVLFVGLESNRGIYSKYAYTLRQFERYYLDLDNDLDIEDVSDIAMKLASYQATYKELEEHKDRVKRDHQA